MSPSPNECAWLKGGLLTLSNYFWLKYPYLYYSKDLSMNFSVKSEERGVSLSQVVDGFVGYSLYALLLTYVDIFQKTREFENLND